MKARATLTGGGAEGFEYSDFSLLRTINPGLTFKPPSGTSKNLAHVIGPGAMLAEMASFVTGAFGRSAALLVGTSKRGGRWKTLSPGKLRLQLARFRRQLGDLRL